MFPIRVGIYVNALYNKTGNRSEKIIFFVFFKIAILNKANANIQIIQWIIKQTIYNNDDICKVLEYIPIISLGNADTVGSISIKKIISIINTKQKSNEPIVARPNTPFIVLLKSNILFVPIDFSSNQPGINGAKNHKAL